MLKPWTVTIANLHETAEHPGWVLLEAQASGLLSGTGPLPLDYRPGELHALIPADEAEGLKVGDRCVLTLSKAT